tara:strand:+ start:181478 stop:181603 length:126 start_codon:yes stop_codon:yes gene_type:complete
MVLINMAMGKKQAKKTAEGQVRSTVFKLVAGAGFEPTTFGL